MNQGIAFARTLRALEAGDFRASKLGLLAAVMILGAWAWWMLAARLPQYESSNDVRIETGRAMAYFPADALSQIHVGQPADVHLSGSAFPARVESIASDHTELLFTSHQPPATTLTPATADVEVSQLSPAALAFRTLTRR